MIPSMICKGTIYHGGIIPFITRIKARTDNIIAMAMKHRYMAAWEFIPLLKRSNHEYFAVKNPVRVAKIGIQYSSKKL